MSLTARVVATASCLAIVIALAAVGFVAWCVIDVVRDRRKARAQPMPAEPEPEVGDDALAGPSDAEIQQMTREYYKQNGGRS